MEEQQDTVDIFEDFSLDEHKFIKGRSDIVRDSFSNGIVNVNEKAYNTYVEKYKKRYEEINKMKSMENELDALKNDIGEIKDLLRYLIQNK